MRQTREAIERYGMVREGDRWLVCLSGGKDSYTLLAVLHELQWRGLLPVELLACNLDQGQPGFPATVLPEFLEKRGVPHRTEYHDTYPIVVDKVPQGRTFCALCSRLRRGNLYRVAREGGCSAVILGRHRDDIMDLCGDESRLSERNGRRNSALSAARMHLLAGAFFYAPVVGVSAELVHTFPVA